jgi:hypothetical protein
MDKPAAEPSQCVVDVRKKCYWNVLNIINYYLFVINKLVFMWLYSFVQAFYAGLLVLRSPAIPLLRKRHGRQWALYRINNYDNIILYSNILFFCFFYGYDYCFPVRLSPTTRRFTFYTNS